MCEIGGGGGSKIFFVKKTRPPPGRVGRDFPGNNNNCHSELRKSSKPSKLGKCKSHMKMHSDL